MKSYLLSAAAVLAFAAPAQAATVFADNFDSYAPQLGWDGSGVWSTGNSVDLVANNTFNLTCAGGSGNCVDLSGSSPGLISQPIALAAGIYQLSFDYTGNQLDDFGGPFPLAGFTATVGTTSFVLSGIANNSNVFQTFTGLFTTTGPGPVSLSFTQNGGNNFRGSIIDNVSITAVPEPATWAMMILGFGIAGAALRRRPAVTVRYA